MANRPTYDPIKDLRPITVAAVTCYAIAVHPSVPVRNLVELVAYAKTNPGKLSFGSAGAGGMNHLSGELFKTLTNTDIQHVPYRGAGPAIADALSGQIPIVVPATNGQLIEFHRSGKLRILAVASPRRLIGAPEIPTGIEAGVPGWIVQNYIALVAPTGTPETIVERLREVTRLAFAGRTAITTSATAADLPVKAPPRLAPVFSWTGCYIGGYIGGAWNGGDGAIFTDQGQNGLGPAGSPAGFLSYGT
jgi:tripartite-type tricarboxylate transporter receptor subunit TctC